MGAASTATSPATGTPGFSLARAEPANLRWAHELTRSNMADFYATTGRQWDGKVFDSSWPHTENYLIRDGVRTIGLVRLSEAADRLYIRDLQVEPAHQRRGAGQFVLKAVREMAIERGLRQVSIAVFATDSGRKLYERAGFEIVATNDDMIRLEWPLGHAP
jgi:GNAT superfamily N-acetyltransferase